MLTRKYHYGKRQSNKSGHHAGFSQILDCQGASAGTMTFLTPTSFIRLDALAVERFIKLIQAINKINRAINENNFTYSYSSTTWFAIHIITV